MHQGVGRNIREAGRLRGGFAVAVLAAVLLLATPASAAEPFLVKRPFSDGFSLTSAHRARSFTVTADKGARLEHGGARLDLTSGALGQAATIRIEPLTAGAVPRLEQGMTNVTGAERAGFRFLPHRQFRRNIVVRLPYEDELIPPGSKAEDLRTFYFDEAAGAWEPLELVRVDTARRVVISRTNHFTDMINAAVTVPDHPAPVGDTPDMFSKTEPAKPTAKVNLIEPPTASSTGEAGLTYPLELPSGRGKLEPALAVRYSSASSNGWLGMGWDLAMRAITIDTRWGVPRYSADVESETYMLEGKQLTPLAHRGAPRPRTAERVFHLRVESTFERIVRHGNSPSNYSWEVTDKAGRRFIYGGTPETTLTDAEGNVFKWALREVRDLHQNTMRYTYARVADPGMAGAQQPGTQLYPKTISYTGSGSADGPYRVTFLRDRELPGFQRRPDVQIDARGGFKMVTADLLKRVDVHFQDRLVRRYELRYREGAFRKTLLEAIRQVGADGTAFNEHRFDYYDDVRDASGYKGFEAATPWDTGAGDEVSADLLGHGQASALGGSLSTSLGGHLYVGFSPAGWTKANSFGAKAGFNRATNDGVLSLIDLNGDSLPDKVFKNDGGVFMRLNRSGPGGVRTFGPARRIATLGQISEETTNTTSAGLEAYGLGGSLLTNFASSSVVGSVYFADVNADGLPDLVADGQVRFNHPTADGVPTFDPDSSGTPVRLPDGPGVDAGGLLPDDSEQEQANLAAYPLHDVLRRWVAPYDGTIRISGGVRLREAPADYASADGVRVAIQHNGSELWSERIPARDTAERAVSQEVSVSKNDRIYFRTQSVRDGLHDEVAWQPRIEYVGAPEARDANDLDPYRYDAAADFVLGGRRDLDIQMPVNGTVRLTGDVEKLGATSDDLTVEVTRNGDSVLRETLAHGETRTLAVTTDFPVTRGDMVRLRVLADSPVNLARLRWAPRLVYTAAEGVPVLTPDGEPTIDISPPYDVDLYPVDNLTAPQAPWRAPANGSYTFTPRITGEGSGAVVFTVKRRGALLGKREVRLGAGAAPISLDLAAGEELFFDYSARDPQLAARISQTRVEIGGAVSEDAPAVLHSAADRCGSGPVCEGVFAQPYRGWGYAGYDGDGARASAPVDEARLRLPDRGDFERPECADRQAFVNQDPSNPSCNIARSSAFAFVPFPAEQRWRGPDENGWVNAAGMSSSRLGADTIDLPGAEPYSGAQAVAKLSRTTQTAVQAGIGPLSGSFSDGSSDGTLDFLDLNGDQFPDVVGTGRVQYTTPSGRLESANRPVATSVRASEHEAFNFGVGGSAAFAVGNARGDVDAGRGAPRGNTTGSQMTSLGLSGGLGRGNSDVQSDLIDVNGDGLPDRISVSGSRIDVALNLGYAFAEPEPWGDAVINAGGSGNGTIGGSLGFNDGIYGFAGGVSLTRNKSRSRTMLADVNGDGLLDRLEADGDELQVALNTGNGFAAPVPWRGAPAGVCDEGVTPPLSGIDWERAHLCDGSDGLGAGVYFTIAIPIPFCTCSIIINPGADGGQTMSRPEGSLRDTDGDGYPDFVASTDDGELSVARNTTGRTNLLKTIERPLGATMELSYERDGNTYEAPQSRWVLSEVDLRDGHAGDGDVAGRPTATTSYRYENGRYDRAERDFFGYAKVSAEQRDPADGRVLRTTVREYDTSSFYRKGLMTRQAVLDSEGRLFTETRNEYDLRDVAEDSRFPMLTRTERRWFEGQAAAGKQTFTLNEYDALGNVSRRFDAGDAGSADDLDARLEYSNCPATYVVGTPVRIEMRGDGRELRRREAVVDCATGDVTDVREFLANGDAAHSSIEYFGDGNLRSVTGPPNQDGERLTISYEYDDATRKYVTRARDSFGLESRTSYDERFDAPLRLTDTTGNDTTNTYDEFGRVTTVTGPYEQGGATPTLRYEYHSQGAAPWALTRRVDSFRSATDTIDSAVLVDGLGRVLQTKDDETVAGDDVMVVSGRTVYDALGRVSERFHPITEPLGTAGAFNAGVDDVAPTRLAYDVLDRTTRTTLPDGSSSTASFGFGTDRDGRVQFERTDTDALGNRKVSYADVRERVTATREPYGAGQSVWTSYEYDPLGQLTAVHDPAGNTTRLAYDNLGRRTVTDNPDTGRVTAAYDLASNVVEKVTGNLRATGGAITYDYEFNRLTDVRHSDSPEIDAHYDYGTSGNEAGRVVRVSDESGTEDRAYGRLGEVVTEVKSVASDTGSQPEVYTTRYRYDTFGRLQELTYPDGELLTYRYDSGGNVASASGVKGGTTYPYVKGLSYDKFGERLEVVAGNDVRTDYRYRSDNLRLEGLTATAPSGRVFQNLEYEYDRVGNVTAASNDVEIPRPPEFGGPTTQTFRYDDLYRLIGATGTYQTEPRRTDRYSVDLGYDELDNIVSKAQRHEIVRPSGNPIEQKATTYAFDYSYDGPQPHAATHIGERTFSYDANGNQTGWDADANGTRRTVSWDDENRVQAVRDNGHELTYKYDDGGDRVIKRGPQGETVYVNRYFTIRNRTNATKHVWVDGTRIASKLMKQDRPGGNPSGNQPLEKDIYYYHPDRIGSANFITDAEGELFEHLEYFPMGETWVQEATNKQRTPYAFTANELDEETGLYYNEARYYDPRVSQFLTADPLLQSSPDKLVGDPGLLSAYTRANNNPSRYTDPTGMEPVVVGRVYVLRGTLDGQAVSYTGSTARELRQRFTGHQWSSLIRNPATQITTYQVSAELNVAASGRGTFASARNEALRAAEQRILNRVERAEGVTVLNRGSAATPAHAEEWMRRHAVRIGRATPYGSALGRGARVGAFGGLAILDAFSMYRDQKMSQYVMAPYVLEDENGSFTLQQQGLIWRSYSKRYISGSLEGQSVSIGSREFGELRDEAEALWGRVNFWGDWEPGLLRRELPVEDPNGCEEAWGVGGPCA